MEGPFPSYDVLGVPISVTTPHKTATAIEQWRDDRQGRFICIRDVPSLMVIRDDPQMARLHHEAAIVTPDGSPIALIGRMRGLPVRRTCGPDLLDFMCSRSPETGLSHYFYGGKDGVAEELAKRMEAKYPGIRIAGYESPPFAPLGARADEATLNRLRNSGADVIWVGMSSPKQDVWMQRHYRHLPQTLIGVGAAFDFHTGAVRRAPPIMQKAMLEWLFRLCQEPKRLWRRYLVLAPKFVLLNLAEKIIPARGRSGSS